MGIDNLTQQKFGAHGNDLGGFHRSILRDRRGLDEKARHNGCPWYPNVVSFRVRLAQDVVSVEPGSTANVALTIFNDGTTSGEFEVQLQGIDADWTAVPVPLVEIKAGEDRTEKFFLRPPRESHSVAGQFPFLVRVRDMQTGDVENLQAVIEVLPFHHLSMEVDPKKGLYSPMHKGNVFEVTVVNLGNTDHSVQLSANDPEGVCIYEILPPNVSIAPGQEKRVELTVKLRRSQFVASAGLVGFSVTGRSVDQPNVAASSSGQLELRGLLSPVSLSVIVILAFLSWLWFINLPMPPTIALGVDPMTITRGDSVRITWKASEKSDVRIVMTNLDSDAEPVPVYQGPDVASNTLWRVDPAKSPNADEKKPVRISFQAIAVRDGMTSRSTSIIVTVNPPEVVPPPTISLSPSASRVALGTSFLLSYKCGPSVTSLRIAPGNNAGDDDLDVSLGQYEITPKAVGITEYKLSARNRNGDVIVKAFKVNVYEESKAVILAFRASKTRVTTDDSSVRIEWQVNKASRVELKRSGEAPARVEGEGSRDFLITAKTTFTLTVFDENGLRSDRTVTVEAPLPVSTNPNIPPNPTDPASQPTPETTGGQPTTAGGTTTGNQR